MRRGAGKWLCMLVAVYRDGGEVREASRCRIKKDREEVKISIPVSCLRVPSQVLFPWSWLRASLGGSPTGGTHHDHSRTTRLPSGSRISLQRPATPNAASRRHFLADDNLGRTVITTN
jgi:hypothetical protein